MQKEYVRWSTFVKIITIIIGIILIIINIRLIKNFNGKPIDYLIIFCTLLMPLFIIFITPLYIVLKDDCIVVKKVIGKIVIPYEVIGLAEAFKIGNGDIRIFGSGGFFGYIGVFSNQLLGKYQSYICNPKDAFMIITKNGKKYAFSCSNRDQIVEYIKHQLK